MTWMLLRLALAQEEVCTPQPLDRWRAEIAAAASAMQEMKVGRAVVLLDDAQNAARCLADVAPSDDLRTFAQLRTLQAFYQQDSLMLETWSRLATSLGPGPWPVAADHPIHRFVDAVQLPPPDRVEDRVLAAPKRGGVFIDGRWSDLPSAIPGTYHLVQVFDADGVRTWADWQDGAHFDPRLLAEGPPPAPPKGWSEDAGSAANEPDWRLARRDRLRSYEHYLKRRPDGEFAAYARRRVDDLTWAETPKNAAGAHAYLERFPSGRNRGAAEAVLQGVEFKETLDDGSTEALTAFLGRYPEGVYAAAARRQLDERSWVDALMDGSEQAYARYRMRWPQGAHFEEARIAQDDLAWRDVEGRGRRAVEGYLRSWPDGGHAREARAYLDGLTFHTVWLDVKGTAAEEARLQAAAVAREELQTGGFELVAAEESAEAVLLLEVNALDVGEGVVRWLTRMEVRVRQSDEPLMTEEVLQDPEATWKALMDLEEGLRPPLRSLGKFRRP